MVDFFVSAFSVSNYVCSAAFTFGRFAVPHSNQHVAVSNDPFSSFEKCRLSVALRSKEVYLGVV